MMQATRPVDGQGDVVMSNTSHFSHSIAAPPTPTGSHAGAYASPNPFAPRPSPTPVPVPQYGQHTATHPGFHQGAHHNNVSHHGTPQMGQPPVFPAHQPHQSQPYNGYQPQYNQTPVPVPQHPHHPPPHQMSQPMPGYDPSHRLAPSPARASIAAAPSPGPHAQANAYNPPRPVEVYHVDDALNTKIPLDIREQFQCDEAGRVLFFTQPPLDRPHRGLSADSSNLGHSVRYLADRARQLEDRRQKRKARDQLRHQEESKRQELEKASAENGQAKLIDVAGDVILSWVGMMNRETEKLNAVYNGWSCHDKDIDKVAQAVGPLA